MGRLEGKFCGAADPLLWRKSATCARPMESVVSDLVREPACTRIAIRLKSGSLLCAHRQKKLRPEEVHLGDLHNGVFLQHTPAPARMPY